jgi:prepilin-type processing-associated H-X9-DG protein
VQNDSTLQFQTAQWYPPNGDYTTIPGGIIRIGYMYRVFDDEFQNPGQWMPPLEKFPSGMQLLRLKLGKLKLRDGGAYTTSGTQVRPPGNSVSTGPIALVADLMASRASGAPQADWPHDNPWGANVGFSDGHVDWIIIPNKRIALLPQQWTGSGSPAEVDHYAYQMFKCYDKNDFTDMNLCWP